MDIFELDPLIDRRWPAYVDTQPAASVFHTSSWLAALRQTYGYAATAYTTSRADAPLTNAIVLCQVRSRFTGFRLVSLPFADHCEPLVETDAECSELLNR